MTHPRYESVLKILRLASDGYRILEHEQTAIEALDELTGPLQGLVDTQGLEVRQLRDKVARLELRVECLTNVHDAAKAFHDSFLRVNYETLAVSFNREWSRISSALQHAHASGLA